MTWAIVALGLGNFAVGVAAYLPVGLLVPIAQDMGVSNGTAGLLLVVYAGVYAISSPILVNVSATWPRRAMLIAALLMLATGTCITALVPDWHLALMGRAIAAVGGGIYTPVAASTAFSVSPPEKRGRNLSLIFFGITFSQAIGLPAGMLIEAYFGWEVALMSVQVFVAIALLAIFIATPKRVGSPKPPASSRLLLKNRTVLIGLALTIGHVSSYNVVYTFLSPLSFANGHGEPFNLLLVVGLAAAIGSVLVSLLADRVRPRIMILMVLIVEASALPIFSISGLPAIVMLATAGFWSLVASGFMVPQQVQLVHQAPNHQSLVLALNATATYAGISLGSGIASVLVDWVGVFSLGIAGGLMAAVTAICLHFLTRPPATAAD